MTGRWEPAFAAMSALLGEPVGSIEVALGERAPFAAEVLEALASSSRATRATAIAATVTRVAIAIEAMGLA